MSETAIKAEIVKKVEEKEFVNRCIAVRVCPHCGTDLVDVGGENLMELQCPKCKKHPYIV